MGKLRVKFQNQDGSVHVNALVNVRSEKEANEVINKIANIDMRASEVKYESDKRKN